MATFAIKIIVILSFVLSSNAFAAGNSASGGKSPPEKIRCGTSMVELSRVKKDIIAILKTLPFYEKINYDPCKAGILSPPEEIKYYKNKAEMIRIQINILGQDDGKYDSEYITIIYTKKGKVIFYRHDIYTNGVLVRTIENGGAVRNIIPGTTDCDFKIVESSGKTTSFTLDPEKEPKKYWEELEDEDTAFFEYLRAPKVPLKIKYEQIMYNQWGKKCRYTVGFWD